MIKKAAFDYIWQEIKIQNGYRFTYKKIDSLCIPDLNLGLDSDGNRCLVLLLPEQVSAKLVTKPDIKRKNIDLFSSDDGEIVLLLKEELHSNLFTDLAFDLYAKIRSSKEDDCALLFVNLVQDWLTLFEPTDVRGLKDEQVKGLIAELCVLAMHLEDNREIDANELIKSWVGPFNTSKDFCLNDKDIEVKFKNTKASKVRISSEYQLTPDPGKGLELWVVSGRVDKEKGVNLTILNNTIKTLIVRRGASVAGYFKTLQMIGINYETISNYDNIMILLEKLEIYDARIPTFPAIRKTSIAEEVSKVSYDINLYSLGAFKTCEKDI
jgi:hypothetical protein